MEKQDIKQLIHEFAALKEKINKSTRDAREAMRKYELDRQLHDERINKIYRARPSVTVVDEYTEYVRDERGF